MKELLPEYVDLFSLREWNEMGYRVLKGMHATSRNGKGEAVFSRTQVVPNNAVRYGDHDPNGQDSWEGEAEQVQAEMEIEDGIWGQEDEIRMDYY